LLVLLFLGLSNAIHFDPFLLRLLKLLTGVRINCSPLFLMLLLLRVTCGALESSNGLAALGYTLIAK